MHSPSDRLIFSSCFFFNFNFVIPANPKAWVYSWGYKEVTRWQCTRSFVLRFFNVGYLSPTQQTERSPAQRSWLLMRLACLHPAEYLLHAPCMRTVQRGYEVCADEYLSQMDRISPGGAGDDAEQSSSHQIRRLCWWVAAGAVLGAPCRQSAGWYQPLQCRASAVT